ncbi:2-oxo acid dehydrogenase subunit E2, partial [Francisella tularensis]
HRIIDGGTYVRFLKMIKELIEDPNRILLHVLLLFFFKLS